MSRLMKSKQAATLFKNILNLYELNFLAAKNNIQKLTSSTRQLILFLKLLMPLLVQTTFILPIKSR